MLIKQDISIFLTIYFLQIFFWPSHDTYSLFAPFKPVAERGGELFGSDSSADPSPGLLEALLGQ